MRKEFVVAEKEFKDHLKSKRFLAMFAIVMILAVAGMVGGLDNYHQQLDQYKTQQAQNAGNVQMIQSMQANLDNLTANGASQHDIEVAQYQLEDVKSPIMPSILTIYYSLTNPFYTVGMILAIAIGFDLISREQDDGTLKSLLSRPIYRDSVINGKAIAAIALIAVVLAATFLISGAILLFNNIVPQGDDLTRMIALYLVSLLYMVVFLAIAMMVSAIARNTSMAMMISLGIVVVLYVLPSIAWPITSALIGPQPQYPQFNYDPGADPQQQQQLQEQMQKQYDQAVTNYMNEQTNIQNIVNGISPQYWYGQLTNAISSRYTPGYTSGTDWVIVEHKNLTMTIWDSLSNYWIGLLVIIVETILAFAVSYVKFMRMDIR